VAGAVARRRRRPRRKVAVPAVIMAISIQWRFFTWLLSAGIFFRRLPTFPF
jgi:hypothetical protein